MDSDHRWGADGVGSAGEGKDVLEEVGTIQAVEGTTTLGQKQDLVCFCPSAHWGLWGVGTSPGLPLHGL